MNYTMKSLLTLIAFTLVFQSTFAQPGDAVELAFDRVLNGDIVGAATGLACDSAPEMLQPVACALHLASKFLPTFTSTSPAPSSQAPEPSSQAPEPSRSQAPQRMRTRSQERDSSSSRSSSSSSSSSSRSSSSSSSSSSRPSSSSSSSSSRPSSSSSSRAPSPSSSSRAPSPSSSSRAPSPSQKVKESVSQADLERRSAQMARDMTKELSKEKPGLVVQANVKPDATYFNAVDPSNLDSKGRPEQIAHVSFHFDNKGNEPAHVKDDARKLQAPIVQTGRDRKGQPLFGYGDGLKPGSTAMVLVESVVGLMNILLW